ncbi:MAG: S-layer homology domain-containing protein [Candidatus Gracilibacteria bacterium]
MNTFLHKNKILLGTLFAVTLITAGVVLFDLNGGLFQSNLITSSGSTVALSKDKPLIGMYYFPGWREDANAWNATYNLRKNNPEREYVTGWEDTGSEAFMDKEIEWASSHGIDYMWLEQFSEPLGNPTYSTERQTSAYAIKNFKKVNNNRLKFNLVWANHDTYTDGQSMAELMNLANYWKNEYFSDPNYLKTPDGKNIIVFWSPTYLKSNFLNATKKAFRDAILLKGTQNTLSTQLNSTACGTFPASTSSRPAWADCIFTDQTALALLKTTHTEFASPSFSPETQACGAYPTTNNSPWTDCLVKAYMDKLKAEYSGYIFFINDDFSTSALTKARTLGADAVTGWTHFNVNVGGPAVFTRYKETVASLYTAMASTVTPIPYFPTVFVGRNMEPWSYDSRTQFIQDDPQQFRELLELAGRFLTKKKQDLPFQMLTIQSWNEMGEGAYLMPTKKWGFGKLEAVEDFKNCMYGHTALCSRTKEKVVPNDNKNTPTNGNIIVDEEAEEPTTPQGSENTIPEEPENVPPVTTNPTQNSNPITNTSIPQIPNQNTPPTPPNTTQNNAPVGTPSLPNYSTGSSGGGSYAGGSYAGGSFIPSQNANTSVVTNVRPSAPLFTDISTHFAKTYIAELSSKGIIQGRTATTFVPNGQLNRAEAAKLIIAATNQTSASDIYINDFKKKNPAFTYLGFPDVPMQSWYAKFVGLAREQNIFSGTQAGLFEPARDITRAEFIKVVINSMFPGIRGTASIPFTDVRAQDWAAPYIAVALEKGLIDKAALFRPNASITRGEAAKILSIALAKK